MEQEQELHIAGIVVHCRPTHLQAIQNNIGRLPGAELHAASADGRLVVTLEAECVERMANSMDAMRALPGVLDVTLVYQHAEPLAALEQEMES